MSMLFTSRVIQGVGASRIFWGPAGSLSLNILQRKTCVTTRLREGARVGILWYWREAPVSTRRVVVIGRVSRTGSTRLPGLSGPLEVRVVAEQGGQWGDEGPVRMLLRTAGYEIDVRKCPTPLSARMYRRLPHQPRMNRQILRQLREIFGSESPHARKSDPAPLIDTPVRRHRRMGSWCHAEPTNRRRRRNTTRVAKRS